MVPSSRVAKSGMVFADRYRLLEPLGAGGMGAVWRAEHLSLRSPVAVKLLNPAIADDPEMLDRFLREAQSAAALRGNYVVQVFDYGVHEGLPFIAMELLSGITLGMRLAAARRLDTNDLSWIFAHVSRAVAKAHELGIVHRDLKPDNIFIVRDGDEEIAKVLDFGIAKVLPSSTPLETDANNTTRTGTVLGTPFYMSPEQARGNRTVDFRADLWSMGVIAFECLTGRLPFASSALGDLVVKICTQPTPRPSALADVPSGFDEWFARACEKQPEARFQSMREQNEALQSLLGTLLPPVSPNRSTPPARHVPPEHSPLSADLSIDFGDFQTLESIAPPAIVGLTTPQPRGESGLLERETADNASGKRLSSAAPVEVRKPPPKARPRWLPALTLAGATLGLTLLIVKSRVQRPKSVPPSSAFVGAGLTSPQPSASSEARTHAVQPAADADTEGSAAATRLTEPVLTNTAPMDSPPAPVKLRRKAAGSTGPGGATSDTAPSRTSIESAPAASPTVAGAGAPEPASTTPSISSTAKSVPNEISRGRELFDDRE